MEAEWNLFASVHERRKWLDVYWLDRYSTWSRLRALPV